MNYEKALLLAQRRFYELTPAERAAHRREQAISFVWGQLASMKEGPKLTREQIAELYDSRFDGEG
jgi:uncharacterized protein (DUF1810 family)